MHRRITSLVQFSPPDYNMRLRIWESLLIKRSSVATSDVPTIVENGTNGRTSNRIGVADDVDFAALAIKFELTGGFIKNALLSAMLIALNRRRDEATPSTSFDTPVMLTQPDLEEGCRLQMRGSLSIRHFDAKVSGNPSLSVSLSYSLPLQTFSGRGVATLALSKTLVDACAGIISMEQSRTIVHGAWGGIGGNSKSLKQNLIQNPFSVTTSSSSTSSTTSSTSASVTSSITLQGEVECWNDTRTSTICAFAGPSGYGKRTLVRALANDLKRSVQIVHISELLAGSGSGRKGGDLADTVEAVENLLQDARISDAVVGIDGFEHVLEDHQGGGGDTSGMKLPLLLSRLLDIFSSFPGLIILLCHLDHVQNLILHKEFAAKIFSFVRFSVPTHEIRAALWRELTPPNAPLREDGNGSVDYVELGRKFELGPRGIANAISRACARVVTRIQQEKEKDFRERETNTHPVHATTTGAGAGAGDGNEEEEERKLVARSVQRELNLRVSQKDFLSGGEAEIAKLKGGNLDTLSKMFS
jgi:hypothetical protein